MNPEVNSVSCSQQHKAKEGDDVGSIIDLTPTQSRYEQGAILARL